MIDEHTRQCLAIHPAWSIRAIDVLIKRRLAASALGDVLFGLIMVLTMTLTAKLTTADDREGVTIFLGS
ncbi:MAG: hypothetical protein WAM53_03850 [Terrimicrobiaceae bacterium]